MTRGSRVLVKSLNGIPLYYDQYACAVVLKVHEERLTGTARKKRPVQFVTIEFIHGDHQSDSYRHGITMVQVTDLDEGQDAIAAHIALRMRGAERTPDGTYHNGNSSTYGPTKPLP